MEHLPLQQIDRTRVLFQRRRLIYFGGCDYFRMASHPGVLGRLKKALTRFGLNVAASRLTTGEHQLYRDLERALARHFGARTATLVSNGYLSNLSAAQALAGDFTHALIDERAHASLQEAAQLLHCPVHRFKHRDPRDLSRLLQRVKARRPVLLTDGLFARDGSVAPLKAYRDTLPGHAWVIVDDAHGAGVLGRTGRGSLEQEHLSRARIVQTITLSKAFGVYGGAVLADAAVRKRLTRHSSIFSGNTPLPLPLADAAIHSLAIVQRDSELRVRLRRNSDHVKDHLRRRGWPIPDHPGPILSLVPSRPSSIKLVRARLFEAGIHPPFIHYPGGPPDGHFRFAFSSEHSSRDLTRLARVLEASQASLKVCL